MEVEFIIPSESDLKDLQEVHNKAFLADYLKYGSCPGMDVRLRVCGNQCIGINSSKLLQRDGRWEKSAHIWMVK